MLLQSSILWSRFPQLVCLHNVPVPPNRSKQREERHWHPAELLLVLPWDPPRSPLQRGTNSCRHGEREPGAGT